MSFSVLVFVFRYDEYRKVYGLTATRQSLFTINPGKDLPGKV